ncbi:hypothetical protein [Ureibacillus sp. GCM10028918]|uniref:hypothetical protein n=1 Tax=Ureibacillus sp. GCM10028918 TaxID=3273429 RepID=UPI0036091543
MSNRWLASLLFVAAFSLPAHAYADGGITDVTNTLSHSVQQTVNQTIFPDSSDGNPEPTNDEESTKTDSPSTENEVPLVKAQASKSADSIKVKVAEVEAEVVAETPAVKASTPLGHAEVAADPQAIKVETPVTEADISNNTPAVKVSALGIADVSADTQAIKVKTPVVEADISANTPADEVSSLQVKIEAGTESPSVKVETPELTEDVSPDLKEEQIEESKNPALPTSLPEEQDNVSPIVSPEQKDGQSTFEPVFIWYTTSDKTAGNREQSISINSNFGQEEQSGDLTDRTDTPSRQLLVTYDNINHVSPGTQPASPTTFYNGQGTSCTSSIWNGTSFSTTGILLTMYLSEDSLSKKALEETKLHYDDWLNAPPTQPPQTSFFLQNIKDTI